MAYSGESKVTICSNLVFCAVMPRVANWASTWANQTSGSDDKNKGSLRLIAETPPVSGLVRGSTDMAGRRLRQKGCVARRGHHLWPTHNQVHNDLTYTAYTYIGIHTRAFECSGLLFTCRVQSPNRAAILSLPPSLPLSPLFCSTLLRPTMKGNVNSTLVPVSSAAN